MVRLLILASAVASGVLLHYIYGPNAPWYAHAAAVTVLTVALLLEEPRRKRRQNRAYFTVLSLLYRHGRLDGPDLVRLSGGVLRKGAVYVLLDRMEDLGLLQSWAEPSDRPGAPPKRKYRITGRGQTRTWELAGILNEPVKLADRIEAVRVTRPDPRPPCARPRMVYPRRA